MMSSDYVPGRWVRWSGVLALSVMVSGCAHMNHTQSGALFGTGVGAVAGSIIGSGSGNSGEGAVIGGLAGALAGGVLGNAEDARVERDLAYMERDAAIAQAQYVSQSRAALNNLELMKLTQSGVGDDVIVNMIRTQGGNFDVSPDAIISLKSAGVSDRVIVAAQNAGPAVIPASATQPGVVVVHPTPTPVFVEPAPFYYGVSVYDRPWYRHRHHHHRGRVGVSFGF